MRSKHLLLELIELLEQYENDNSDTELSVTDFIGFLNARYEKTSLEIRDVTGGQETEMVEDNRTPDIEITRLVSLMYRYGKGYIRKALKESIIQTADEFSFVIMLMTYTSLSKTELITKNIMEKTSGTEVIKRLIRNGLIRQFDDQKDKRAQRVAVTEKGKAEIYRVLPNMQTAATIVAGNLTDSEKFTLAYLLKKLDYHHNNLYLHHRDANLEELAARSTSNDQSSK